MTPDYIPTIARLLRVPSLHPWQQDIITATFNGRDVLAICPTGSGKSVAFWGAGIAAGMVARTATTATTTTPTNETECNDGGTAGGMGGGAILVVSPLRSLIADQHRRLAGNGAHVRIWNSDVSTDDKEHTVRLLLSGCWSGFLYCTPEAVSPTSRRLLPHLRGRVRLAVIDEAHCVLRDRGFRPDFACLGDALDQIHPRSRLACTATLPARDRARLIAELGLKSPLEVTLPVSRSNITISVVARSPTSLSSIVGRVHRNQPGIIFTATIRAAKALSDGLRGQGYKVGLYHGKLPGKKKTEAQDSFMDGSVPVMIATDAFLLGIDKRDIRFTVHYDYPESIEDWCQGFGRAGRDGGKATAYGLFRGVRPEDDSRLFLLRATWPDVDEIRAVWLYIKDKGYCEESERQIGARAIGNGHGSHAGEAAVSILQRHGLVSRQCVAGGGRLYSATGLDWESVSASGGWDEYENEKIDARRRYDRLRDVVRMPEGEISGEIDRYFAET